MKLLLYLSPFLFLQAPQRVFHQGDLSGTDTKHIIMKLGKEIESPFGIPLEVEGVKKLDFFIREGQVSFAGDNGIYFIIELFGDSLHVELSGNHTKGHCQFKLLPKPKTEYRTVFDPETYTQSEIV